MAIKSKADLQTDIDTLLANNSNGEISEEDVRTVLENIKDSLLSRPEELDAAGAMADGDSLTMVQGADEVVGSLRKLKEYIFEVKEDGGTNIVFSQGRTQYGTTAAPEVGNITVDTNNAKAHTTVLVVHQKAIAPTYPPEVKLVRGAYDTVKTNYMWFTFIDATHILLNIEVA